MNPLETLSVELVASVQKFVKDADGAVDKVAKNANDSFDKIEKKGTSAFGKIGGAIGDMGKIAGGFLAATAISAGIGQVTSFVGGAVTAAKDLGESLNAVNVVFKESSDKVLQWGKDNATAYGLSSREFNQLVTPIGAMLQNYGFSADEAGDKSIELTKRAADMASVFNVEVGDALTAIQAGLRGESDPLEKFGVGLNAAAIQTKALAMTGKTLASALTDQEKKAASMALILEQTASVEGDFANTSGDLANATRIAAAETEEMQAKLGQKLLPVTLLVTKAKLALTTALVDQVIPAIEYLVVAVQPAVDAFKSFVATLRTGFTEDEGTKIERIALAIRGLGDEVLAVANFINAQLGPAWAQLQQLIEGLIPIVKQFTQFVAEHKEAQIALAVVAAALVVAIAPIPIAIIAIIAAGTLLLAHWDEIRAAIDEQIAKWQEIIDKISEIPVIGEIVQAAFDGIVAIITAAVETIVAVVQTQIDILIGLFKIGMALIQGDFGKAWDEIKALVGTVFEDLKGIFSIQLGLIRDLIWIAVQGFAGVVSDGAMLLLEAGTKLMQALYDGVVTAGVDLLMYFINLPGRIIGELGDLGTKLYNYAYDAVGEMAKGVTAAIDKVLGAFGKLAGKLNPFSSPPGFHELPGQYNAFGKSLTQSLTDGIHGGLAQVSGAMGKVADALGRSGGGGDGGWAGIGKRIGEAVQKGFSTGNTDGGWAGVGQAAGAAIAGGMQGAIGGIAKVVGEGMQGVAGVVSREVEFTIGGAMKAGLERATRLAGGGMSLGGIDWMMGVSGKMQAQFDSIDQLVNKFNELPDAARKYLGETTGILDQFADAGVNVFEDFSARTQGVQDALDHVAAGAGSMHDALLLANAGFVDMANGIVQLNLGLISSADLIAIYNGGVTETVDAVAQALANYDLLASVVEMAHDKTLGMHEAQLLAQAGFEGLGVAIRDYNLGLIDADELTRQVEATFTEVATSAAVLGAQWTTAFADAMGREDLLEAVGSAGVRILDQLDKVLTEGGQKNVETLAGMVASMLTELESTLPADEAAVLGETITDALQEAIEKGTPEAIQAVVDLLDGANEAMHNGTTKILTSVDKFNVLLGNKVADKALQDKVGKNGADLMGALNTAIETGGAKGVETMAQEAFDIIGAMGKELEPGAADYLGGQLMSALQTALETGGADAVAAVMAVLAQINALIAGAPTTIPAPTLAGAPATSPKGSGGSPSDDGAHGSTPTPTKAPRKTRQNKIDDIIKRLTGFDPSAARQAVLDMFNAIYTGQPSKKFADDVGYNAGINWADFKNYLRSLGHVSFDQGGLLMPGFTPVWNGTGVPEQVIAPGAGGNSTRSTNYGKQYFIYGPGRQSKDVIRDLDKLLA